MKILETYIKTILIEDLSGFVDDTQGISYGSGSSAQLEFDKVAMSFAKRVKKAWTKNADHAFMKTLTKVHWFEHSTGLSTRLKWFLDNQGKDEVTTSAYLPGQELKSTWGDVGVILDGRVTLAANDMDTILSGYASEYPPSALEKYKSSGVPKRAGVFGIAHARASDYVLDSSSFKQTNLFSDNEFIVDNWKVKALVLGENYKDTDPDYLQRVLDLAKSRNLPIVSYK
jgi:hypothetical protein